MNIADFDSRSASYDAGSDVITPVSGGNTYTQLLLEIHLLYGSKETTSSRDVLTLRASWSNTLGRPGFEESKAGVFIDGNDVEIGNPKLDSLESTNYDFGTEYESFAVSGQLWFAVEVVRAEKCYTVDLDRLLKAAKPRLAIPASRE